MAREGINLIQQIGVEVTPGTPVAATARLSNLDIQLNDTLETKQFRSMAVKSNTTSVIHKLMARGNYNGPLSYVEICYILSSLAPSAVNTVGGVSTWTFLPNPIGSDAFKTFTLECGDDEAQEQYAGMVFNGLEVLWGLEDATMSGEVFSEASGPLAGLTASVPLLAERPVSRDEIDVYVDDTYGAIGTTKITDAFEARFRIGQKFEPKWVLNTDYASYKEAYEKIPELSMTITIEANSQGRTLVADLLANNTGKFLSINAVGGIITGATPYSLTVEGHFKITALRPQKNYGGGLYAYELDFTAIHNESMGRAWRVTVVNALAAL
jgi:hypothetical protein